MEGGQSLATPGWEAATAQGQPGGAQPQPGEDPLLWSKPPAGD